MSSFRTEVEVTKHAKRIEYDYNVMFLGSCFATNVGDRFKQSRLNAMVNPYGVIYNPMSIANTIESIVSNRFFKEDDLNLHGEHWHSFLHHSSFSDRDKAVCLLKINKTNSKAYNFLKSAKIIFITFGTAWVYQWLQNDQIVSNCHKYPAKEFNRFLLNIDEIVDRYKKLLTELLVFNPDIQVVFTVSPVRHWKDGAHGNQLSKSTLLLAINNLVEQFESCSYFPAYELVMDDLRDYRFYAGDMIHPNEVAIDYIWEKFKYCFFSSETLEYIKEMHKLDKAIGHRPYDSASESHQNFLAKQVEKIHQLNIKYPKVDFSLDLDILKSKII